MLASMYALLMQIVETAATLPRGSLRKVSGECLDVSAPSRSETYSFEGAERRDLELYIHVGCLLMIATY